MGAGFGIPPEKGTFTAYTDLSSYQYKAVKFSSSRTVTYAGAATDLVIGILQNKPNAAGRPAEVVVRGESKAVSGGSISAGAFLVAGAAGVVVSATIGVTTANCCVGRALEDADSGDVFRIDVNTGHMAV